MESLRLRADDMIFRLWIVQPDAWQATCWSDVPPPTPAVELVEDALYSPAEAAIFAKTFNQVMLDTRRPLWVVAVPIKLELTGDAQPGMPVSGYPLETAPATTDSVID